MSACCVCVLCVHAVCACCVCLLCVCAVCVCMYLLPSLGT
jgi:hypothetical protein